MKTFIAMMMGIMTAISGNEKETTVNETVEPVVETSIVEVEETNDASDYEVLMDGKSFEEKMDILDQLKEQRLNETKNKMRRSMIKNIFKHLNNANK